MGRPDYYSNDLEGAAEYEAAYGDEPDRPTAQQIAADVLTAAEYDEVARKRGWR